MTLARETTDRQATIWDQLSGSGPFSVDSDSFDLPEGGVSDAIHVTINRGFPNEQKFVVLYPGTDREEIAEIILERGEQRLKRNDIQIPFQ